MSDGRVVVAAKHYKKEKADAEWVRSIQWLLFSESGAGEIIIHANGNKRNDQLCGQLYGQLWRILC